VEAIKRPTDVALLSVSAAAVPAVAALPAAVIRVVEAAPPAAVVLATDQPAGAVRVGVTVAFPWVDGVIARSLKGPLHQPTDSAGPPMGAARVASVATAPWRLAAVVSAVKARTVAVVFSADEVPAAVMVIIAVALVWEQFNEKQGRGI
jgi:hypothetical protein